MLWRYDQFKETFISKQKYGSRFEPKLQIYKAKILGYFVVWNRIKRGHLRMQDLWRDNHGMGWEPLPSFVHHRNWYHSCFSVSKYGNLQRFVLIINIYFKKSKEGKVEKIKLAWIQKITKNYSHIHPHLFNEQCKFIPIFGTLFDFTHFYNLSTDLTKSYEDKIAQLVVRVTAVWL